MTVGHSTRPRLMVGSRGKLNATTEEKTLNSNTEHAGNSKIRSLLLRILRLTLSKYMTRYLNKICGFWNVILFGKPRVLYIKLFRN